jgi:hypothetical protein
LRHRIEEVDVMSAPARHPVYVLAASIAWAVCAAAHSAPVIVESKLLEIQQTDFFDNPSHFAGAIELGSGTSVPADGVRSVWGVRTSGRLSASNFDSLYLANTRIGVHFEIGGPRDLQVVLPAADGALFGHSSSGAVTIHSKVGSDSLVPGTTAKHGSVLTPYRLSLTLKPALKADYGFWGSSTNALFLGSNDDFSPIVKVGDPVPGRPGLNFNFLSTQIPVTPKYAGFVGSSVGVSGAYVFERESGNTYPVLENVWALSPYGIVSSIDLDGEKVAVASEQALSLTDASGSGPVHVLVPAGAVYAPGASLSAFSEVNLHGDRIAFRAAGTKGATGAFLTDLAGTVQKIVDGDTPIPGGSGNFGFVQQIGLSDDMVAFIGFDRLFQQAGLFAYLGGEIVPIARPGDMKGTKTINRVDFQSDALDGNVLAYTAYFTDASSASYLVGVLPAVPEPSAWILLLAGLSLLGARLRLR